jgi:hypothetical protein
MLTRGQLAAAEHLTQMGFLWIGEADCGCPHFAQDGDPSKGGAITHSSTCGRGRANAQVMVTPDGEALPGSIR